jgi:hypothetical protein
MTLSPGTEDIDYNGYRLEIRHHGTGYKIYIYPPESRFSLKEISWNDDKSERKARIAEAMALADADIKKKQG